MAQEGYEALCKEEPLLERFRVRLFSDRLAGFDISILREEDKRSLAEEIDAFLILLTPYYMEKETHKVLEWMVRKWRVNELHLDALLGGMLQYHETPEFVRMVQICYLPEESTWHFLSERVKANGHTLPRSYIAHRCVIDVALLTKLFRLLSMLVEEGKKHPEYRVSGTYVSFVTFVTMEALDTVKVVTDTVAVQYFNQLEKLLNGNQDCLVGALMVYTQLSERASLSDEAHQYFFRRVLSEAQPLIHKNVVATLIRTVELGYLEMIEPEVAVQIAEMDNDVISQLVLPYTEKLNLFIAALKKALEGQTDALNSMRARIPSLF